MSNTKDRGNDGKNHRKPVVKKDAEVHDQNRNGLPMQANPDRASLVMQCVREDELKRRNFPVTYESCVGNIFSEEDQTCIQCGVCQRISSVYNRVGFSHLATLSLENGSAGNYISI
ncbi:MAG: hypothetical protein Q8L11_01335 [Candidatus Moranbacteria bacterium]|nr:hypothetical protein [bacterium]MDP1833559.1 hypothetical protein [Candidatus Moranbacteria bacterium]